MIGEKIEKYTTEYLIRMEDLKHIAFVRGVFYYRRKDWRENSYEIR